MEPREYAENVIRTLEKQLKLPITVVDHDGWFQFKQKSQLFDDRRRSHKKLAVCNAGFCAACRANCRYRLNQLCSESPRPHYTVCWKQVGQIAVPLRRDRFHYGVLYAGAFRPGDAEPPRGLPEKFYRAYAKLPPADPAQIGEWMKMLDMFARGLVAYLCEENILNLDYDFRVRKLLAFLEAHYAEKVTLEDAARHLALSKVYASSFIKRATGSNFSVLLRSFRINHARKLLSTTEETLRSIAEACGFSSEFHLSKVFKQQTGESPSQFRRRS